MKFYTICEPNGKVIFSTQSDFKPEFSTEKKCSENFITPYFDFKNEVFFEGASDEEVQKRVVEMRKQCSTAISAIEGMTEAVERFMFDGTLPSDDLRDKRELIKSEYEDLIK